jgi:AraC family transcriptional regulator
MTGIKVIIKHADRRGARLSTRLATGVKQTLYIQPFKERSKMENQEVRMIQLEPMRVASAHGFGPNPEELAHQKMLRFARKHHLLDGPNRPRCFGFNNPSPTPASPNYGYEDWIVVGPEVEGDEEVEVKNVPGGYYAVLHCENLGVIGERWQRLAQWAESSPYHIGSHQWLEELLVPLDAPPEAFCFDLYLPVEA